MKLLDLFSGRWGWSRAFAARGWDCVGVDLIAPAEIPPGCGFIRADVLKLDNEWVRGHGFDFVVASSPCDEFSCHGMKHFQPNPPFPALAIKLFEHTRLLCEASGLPYIMENVRSAQPFVGKAENHCGPFYLWGNAVPPLMPQGITKAKWRPNAEHGRIGKPGNFAPELLLPKAERKAKLATIPVELAHCVAKFAERITKQVISEFPVEPCTDNVSSGVNESASTTETV